jgi:hypothetical protein
VRSPVWRYGVGGALLTDEPFDGLTEELTGQTAVDYGARYMIAESMSLAAARQIARAFGAGLRVEKSLHGSAYTAVLPRESDPEKRVDLGVAGFQVGDTVRSLRATRDHEGPWRVVEWRPAAFQERKRIVVARLDDEAIRFFDPEDMFELVELAPPFLAEVVYFKPGSGKYYTIDEQTPWPRDPSHYTGWAPFSSLHRIQDMFAVCMETPLGFPCGSPRKLEEGG